MNRYENNCKKQSVKLWNKEHKAGGFRCAHCKRFVVINDYMGTANRNHCNSCLWSRHVDQQTGDRRANCGGGMQPVGLTYKQTGADTYGEIMLIHICSSCQKVNINRVARDDPDHLIEMVFAFGLSLSKDMRQTIELEDIYILDQHDAPQLRAQLYGLR